MTKNKTDIRKLSLEELVLICGDKQFEKFRARQIWDWLWKHHANNFEAMDNLPKAIREWLQQNFTLDKIKIALEQHSSDTTIKVAFELYDNQFVEGVLIPADERVTACISSQVGCSLGCAFCATGQMGMKRNLDFLEIYDQVLLLNSLSEKHFNCRLSNVVLMGMGEPLLNYENVTKAIELITNPDNFNFSPQRITLSTVGLVKMIKKMADDKVRYNLAVSLHTANNKKRDSLIPVNKYNPLPKLADALRYFYQQTQSRITFEYLLLQGVNDGITDAKELAEFCKNVPCKINLIEYNPVKEVKFKKSEPQHLKAFAEYLQSKNLIVNLRRSRGKDINAACGQLAIKQLNIDFDKPKK